MNDVLAVNEKIGTWIYVARDLNLSEALALCNDNSWEWPVNDEYWRMVVA